MPAGPNEKDFVTRLKEATGRENQREVCKGVLSSVHRDSRTVPGGSIFRDFGTNCRLAVTLDRINKTD